jgi:predicted Ser/Thr protein kinase
MDTQRVCGSCGKPLADDAPQGLCPECLMKAGFGSASGPPVSATAGFVPPSLQAMTLLFPQLEMVELIGQGGMGAVYKARQPALDRLVALKILPPRAGSDPGFAERFTREARTLAKLSHPNIVAVYDFGQAQGLHYFLMEYIDGPNLRQVEQAGKLSPTQALQIIPQICEALQFAHDEGIVHRDIKPENVLLDKKGRVKIADFGLAKILGLEARNLRLTGTREVMGTPHYMAPEQVQHPQEVDHRADIYSLGVVFYEMLTGELPLGRFAPPSRKVSVDVRLDEVVLHALEREPALRYQKASQVKSDLETIASQPGKPIAPVSDGESERLRTQVRWPAIGLVATGILNWVLIPFILMLGLPALSRARTTVFHHVALGQADVIGLGLSKLAVLGLLAAPFVLCGFLIYAAFKMMRLESYAAAIAAAIVGMVVTPGNIIGFPIGIWALMVLSRREIRDAFRQNKVAGSSAGIPTKTRTALLWLGAAGAVILFAGLLAVRSSRSTLQEPAATAVVLRTFETGERPISGDFARTEGGAWVVSCTQTQTFRLFEVPEPNVQDCMLTYRARIKTEGLAGRAYLEMWCRLPGQGESFSRGLDNVASGSNDWVTYETPFFLKTGERPDLVRLNLVVEGAGKVFIKDIELLVGRLNSAAAGI